jgi:hypothetical protein
LDSGSGSRSTDEQGHFQKMQQDFLITANRFVQRAGEAVARAGQA